MYIRNLTRNPSTNRRTRPYVPYVHQHPAPAPPPPIAGMASTSGRDQVNSTPIPAHAPAPSPPSVPVSAPIQVMTAGESEPMSSSDLRYRWLIDSGASVHISNNLSHFTTLDTNPALCPPVTYGDGESVKASGVGIVRIKGDQGDIITLTDVL
jgi:hypothetical protein